MSEDLTKEQEKKVIKSFGLTNLSLKNKNTVYLLAVLVVLMGISTYQSLPKDSYPEIEQPIVYIGTSYPGNSPLDIENLITRPIEKEINTISEVDEIKSTSVDGYSTIIVEFQQGTPIEDALQKAKDAVDRAKPELPTDLDRDPDVFEMNFSEFPIMNINLSGNYSMDELKQYAELLEEEIEKIKEISKVDITGVEEKEVQVRLDPFLMEAREVSFQDVEDALRYENKTLSSGDILIEGNRRNVRVLGEFERPEEMLEIVVKQEDNAIVYLRDIAEVEFAYKEKTSYARLATKPVVSVDVIKRSGENLLIATAQINQVIEDLKPRLPDDLEIVKTNDQSTFTADLVSGLENNIISGVILVVLVLLFFLGTRNALFVGIAIPLSMFTAFIIIGALGYTINMMILFSLIMALGMLVDNGIVVVENVYRKMEEGLTGYEAARQGVGEVAMPIIASTATTIAAFLPLMMWPGMMGEFMKLLPLGLIITLSSSLFVALVINPVLVSAFMRVDHGEIQVKYRKFNLLSGAFIAIGLLFIIGHFATGSAPLWFGNLLVTAGLLVLLNIYVLHPAAIKFQDVFLPWLENLYSRFLEFALNGWRPIVFFIGTFVLLIFSFMLMGIFPPKVLFFPENEPKYVNVFIEYPIGTDISKTNALSEKLELKVLEVIKPYNSIVESVITKVGEDTADPQDPSAFGQSSTPNKARITVNFKDYRFRVIDGRFINTINILNQIREEIGEYPGVTVTVDKDANGPPVGKAITIEVVGPDFEPLIDITERMRQYILASGIEGIEKLKTDLETGKPELLIHIDRDNARRFGLSTGQIATEIRTALYGKEVSKYKVGEDDYEIQIRLKDDYRYNLDALMNKSITFRNQSTGKIHQVPISAVAKAEFTTTYGSVKRKDMDRIVTLSSNVLGGYNPTEVNQQIEALLESFEMPYGYSFRFGGEQKEQEEEMSFLGGALMLAVMIIFLIIVAQFNKITTPLIIMTSVLLSTAGVFIGMIVFNMEFIVIMTMLGIISLAGIVVNNAIVLIDFIELKRKRMALEQGVDKLSIPDVIVAIREAGKTRLRPVLLTAITTILGLIPLAVGINIDFIKFYTEYDAGFYLGGDNVIFWSPMSWTIIHGLTFATFLTLVIVPIMYLFFARINRKMGVS
jgi:multidrug efflux pump